MIKKYISLLAVLLSAGCANSVVYAEPITPDQAQAETGCFVVSDDFGEREVCDTQYYVVNDGVVYYDTHFGVWVSPNGWWRNGVWTLGAYPGFHAWYGRGYYHNRGFYGYHGGWRGGHSYRGGYHGGGFYGRSGGHGGHR